MAAAHDNLPDDYALQHYAIGDDTEGRSFWRTTIRGENPVAPVRSAPPVPAHEENRSL
jgi:hypothetical protein